MSQKGTILIVEDQPGFRRIYEEVLAESGYEVLLAEDGERGWELVLEKRPDLILLDLGLPKIDGFEVLKRIRSQEGTKGIPVIIFSVMGDEKDIKKALEMGANDYTIKGFYTPRQILSKVKGLVLSSEAPASSASLKLEVQASARDAGRLAQTLGLEPGLACPNCGTAALLEVFPDAVPEGEHWFRARWTCPDCRKVF